MKSEPLRKRCYFETERLKVKNWEIKQEKSELAINVIKLLTPKVTKTLPTSWKGVDNVEKALNWIDERNKESSVFSINLNTNLKLIGFLFLTENDTKVLSEVRLGYLISEFFWGERFGTELIMGFVEWCKNDSYIKILYGGVERNNIASIKILEKNGFIRYNNLTAQNTIFYKKII